MRYDREETKLNLMMLLEEEGDDAAEESGGTDSATGDAGDVPENSDDEAADDSGDTKTEEEEEDIEVEPHEEAQLKNPLEAQVDAVLADFEMSALKSAKVNESSLMFLLEDDDAIRFDVNSFAEDTARLIANYETLLDIESAIYYRAVSILEKNYGRDIAETFKDVMQQRHGYDFGDVRPDPVKDVAPLAVGSGAGAGGA